jgi:RNA polymerase sigma factor (sigma-70 family)
MPESAVREALADAHRREWAFVLAAVVRVTRDLDLAEECVQDAYAKAAVAWSQQGVPTRPGAWLTTAARNRAFDVIRRESTARRSLPLLVVETVSPIGQDIDEDIFGDDRLRLIFTCCHPTLSAPARVALTLRLVCGVTTAEIARSFLVSEPTMAARITRAKKKIAAAHIPYRIPAADELPVRTDAVLDVIHQLFTTGHTAPLGAQLVRNDLTSQALDMARMSRILLPGNRKVIALLALILLSGARADARLAPDGSLRLLADQDRNRWDASAIAEGTALVRESLRDGPPGKYALLAAINALHDEAPAWDDTDWPQIVGLYDHLVRIWPTPVVELNRAVAIRFADGPAAGLAALDRLVDDPRLAVYPYLAATRADCFRDLGRYSEARPLYEEAILLTGNDVERAFLTERLQQLPG